MPRMTDALNRLMPWRTGNGAAPVTKASKAHRLVAVESLGQPQWAPRDYATFAREGFMQNAIVYRSVRMVAEAAASIPLLLYEGAFEIESHPFLDLIAHPSLDHTSADFFEAWYGYLLVSGNAYVEAVGVDERLRELHVLRPDRMKVIPGPDGWPEEAAAWIAPQQLAARIANNQRLVDLMEQGVGRPFVDGMRIEGKGIAGPGPDEGSRFARDGRERQQGCYGNDEPGE